MTEIREAIEALNTAYENAARIIENEPDADRAYDQVGQLAEATKLLVSASTELRARVVGRIWETEELSLGKLAQRIGVSKARADQLIRARKKAEGRADT